MREVDPEVAWRMLHPRPVVLVGAGDLAGKYSFAPASWDASVRRAAGRGGSAERGVLHPRASAGAGRVHAVLLSMDQLDEILFLGSVSGKDVDKLSVVGWRAAQARVVGAPVLDNALGVLECRVRQTVQVDEMTLILADVVGAEVVEETFNDRYGWDLRRVKTPLHAAGRAFMEPGRLVLADAGRFRAGKG
ncbi:MAG: flavin reductase [Candidatus Korarchaeota archaeon]|nr:flavin reductase [Candidatus Korarchaeota archaeon]